MTAWIMLGAPLAIGWCVLMQPAHAEESQSSALGRLAVDIPGRHFADTADHVHLTDVSRSDTDGDTLLIKLQIDPGYHINANPASFDYLVPTRIALPGGEPERIKYPPPVFFKPRFADKPIAVYEGSIVIATTFGKAALDRNPALRVTVTVQACTDQICLPPADFACVRTAASCFLSGRVASRSGEWPRSTAFPSSDLPRRLLLEMPLPFA